MGVDGGGTGCRAVLSDADGTILSFGQAGPANISADTPTALLHIEEAARHAAQAAGLDISIWERTQAVLGLAGANALADRDSVAQRLPFGRSRIVSDTVTALQGALGAGDGAIAILGTGSAFVRRTADSIETVGGRGFMLSDHAGGARLGRELLEHALLAADGMAGRTPLVDAALARFDGDARKITAFSRAAAAADYAVFAPAVFDHAQKGDSLALRLLENACAAIRAGLDRVEAQSFGRFSLTGGLAAAYAALPFFPYREFYVPPRGDSLQGALQLALAGR